MARSRKITDVRIKMALAELKLEIRSDDDWADILQYAHVSSISRLRSGKNCFPDQKLKILCQRLGVDLSDFDLSVRGFGVRIGLESSNIDGVVKNNQADIKHSNGSRQSDIDLLDKLNGEYIQLYLGNESYNVDIAFLSVERINIFHREQSIAQCKIKQTDNIMTELNPEGVVTCKKGKLVANISYPGDSYPDSILYLDPLVVDEQSTILSGIYTDITVGQFNEIFSTRVVLVKVPANDKFEQKYHSNTDMYKRWKEVLTFELSARKRLASPFGFSYVGLLHEVVNTTIR